MFVPCINSIKELFIYHSDAHNYKITGILKQLKFRRSQVTGHRSDRWNFNCFNIPVIL
jgi:hypothetical protein